MPNQDTLYARWLNGDISPEEEKALHSSGEWVELEAIIKAADSLALPKYDQDIAYKLLKTKRIETKTVSMSSRWIMGVAAGVALLIVAYFVVVPSDTEISAAYTENRIHKTFDESRIVLNDGSRISYDNSNWEKERNVKLTGEASFDVTKGVPFVVETSFGKVEVLGTSFNVRSWDNAIVVECYTGRVKVSFAGNENILTKGKGVKMGKSENAQFDFDHDKAQWQSGLSKFNNVQILDVFSELGRQFDVKVNYEGVRMRFTGGFVHDDLQNALYQITSPLGLSYEIKPNNIVRVFK